MSIYLPSGRRELMVWIRFYPYFLHFLTKHGSHKWRKPFWELILFRIF